MATVKFKNDGDAILLIGAHGSHLGQSIYLREIQGREDGPPPPVDLAVEKRNGDFVRNLIKSGQVTAVHDISDGGLASAVIEMALTGNLGAEIYVTDHTQLFGEDQARYVVTCSAEQAATLIAQAQNIEIIQIGKVAGKKLKLGDTKISLRELRHAHESWFPAFMAG